MTAQIGTTQPEIPDSSKWSSNYIVVEPSNRTSKPEIPDSSKWSSNGTDVQGIKHSVIA